MDTRALSEKGKRDVYTKIQSSGRRLTDKFWLKKAHENLYPEPKEGWTSYWNSSNKSQNERPPLYMSLRASWNRFRGGTAIASDKFDAFCKILSLDPVQVMNANPSKRTAILGDPPESTALCGRQSALQQLKTWGKDKSCRLIILYGQAGIGKTYLARQMVDEVLEDYDCCIWLNLETAPSFIDFIGDLTQELCSFSPSFKKVNSDNLEEDLLTFLSEKRCLVVLDDWEVILRNSQNDSNNYKEFLTRISASAHQSCFLIASQASPYDFLPVTQDKISKRAKIFKLDSLTYEEDKDLLTSEGLFGNEDACREFLRVYDNPWVIHSIAPMINRISGGDVSKFLEPGITILWPFSDGAPSPTKFTFNKEIDHLTGSQRFVVYTLALWRNPLSCDQLLEETKNYLDQNAFWRDLASLIDSSIIQRQEQLLVYFLKPLMLKAVTIHLQDQLFNELVQMVDGSKTQDLSVILSQSLLKDENDEVLVGEVTRRIIQPISSRLIKTWGSDSQVRAQLKKIQETLNDRDKVGMRNLDLILTVLA